LRRISSGTVSISQVRKEKKELSILSILSNPPSLFWTRLFSVNRSSKKGSEDSRRQDKRQDRTGQEGHNIKGNNNGAVGSGAKPSRSS